MQEALKRAETLEEENRKMRQQLEAGSGIVAGELPARAGAGPAPPSASPCPHTPPYSATNLPPRPAPHAPHGQRSRSHTPLHPPRPGLRGRCLTAPIPAVRLQRLSSSTHCISGAETHAVALAEGYSMAVRARTCTPRQTCARRGGAKIRSYAETHYHPPLA